MHVQVKNGARKKKIHCPIKSIAICKMNVKVLLYYGCQIRKMSSRRLIRSSTEIILSKSNDTRCSPKHFSKDQGYDNPCCHKDTPMKCLEELQGTLNELLIYFALVSGYKNGCSTTLIIVSSSLCIQLLMLLLFEQIKF